MEETETIDSHEEKIHENETIQDEAHALLIKQIEGLDTDEKLKESFKGELHHAIWDIKVLRGDKRVKSTLSNIQKFHELKNEYYKSNEIDEVSGINEIIYQITVYLNNLNVELTTKESLLQ